VRVQLRPCVTYLTCFNTACMLPCFNTLPHLPLGYLIGEHGALQYKICQPQQLPHRSCRHHAGMLEASSTVLLAL
jgi:hypothetical protein